ncbi:MAG: DUF4393 domain-containing protein [Acinetobacter calcoaceticus]
MAIIDTTGLEPFADLLKEVYGDLAKPGVAQVGIALATVIGLINTCLSPIKFLNEKTELNRQNNLKLIAKRFAEIPPENIIEAPSEIAVPIAEKLVYVSNDVLRNMYIELMAKASTNKLNDSAHPSFINIINNLSPDEALLLGYLRNRPYLPYVDIILKGANNIQYHIEDLVCLTPGLDLNFQNNFKAYLSNLEANGLVNVMPDRVFVDEKEYEIYINYMNNNLVNYEKNLKDLKKDPFSHSPYQLIKGTIEVTDFGHLFFNAVY